MIAPSGDACRESWAFFLLVPRRGGSLDVMVSCHGRPLSSLGECDL